MATKGTPGKPQTAKQKAGIEPTLKERATAGKVQQRERLDEIEKRLEELRRRFDLYFVGSPEQRFPPTTNKEQMGGELRRIREEEVRMWNTIDKFRFSQIFARFVSMDRMWARTLKQIEDGTYKRDKMKVGLRKKADEEAAAQQQQQQQEQQQAVNDTQVGQRPAGAPGAVPASVDGLDVDVGSFDENDMITSHPPQRPVTDKAVPKPVPVGAGARATGATGGGGGGGGNMSEQRLKQLYDVYIQAKKRTGESSSLTMDGLRKQIEKQIPAIKAKHKCENVEFKVVLKDGKAMLKAVPK